MTETPTAPTAESGTNTTQIATTAFVQTAVAGAGGGVVQIAVDLESATVADDTGEAVDEAYVAGQGIELLVAQEGVIYVMRMIKYQENSGVADKVFSFCCPVFSSMNEGSVTHVEDVVIVLTLVSDAWEIEVGTTSSN